MSEIREEVAAPENNPQEPLTGSGLSGEGEKAEVDKEVEGQVEEDVHHEQSHEQEEQSREERNPEHGQANDQSHDNQEYGEQQDKDHGHGEEGDAEKQDLKGHDDQHNNEGRDYHEGHSHENTDYQEGQSHEDTYYQEGRNPEGHDSEGHNLEGRTSEGHNHEDHNPEGRNYEHHEHTDRQQGQEGQDLFPLNTSKPTEEVVYTIRDRPQFNVTRALFIGNLTNPFSNEQFQKMLADETDKTDSTIERAWLNPSRSHCIVLVSDVRGATSIQENLNGRVFPLVEGDVTPEPATDENGKEVHRLRLYIEYMPVKAIQTWIDEENNSPRDAIWRVFYEYLSSERQLIAQHEMINYPNEERRRPPRPPRRGPHPSSRSYLSRYSRDGRDSHRQRDPYPRGDGHRERPRDVAPRDYPSRDAPPAYSREYSRDYPPRDYPPRDYPPRDYPPRDYYPRDVPSRERPPRERPTQRPRERYSPRDRSDYGSHSSRGYRRDPPPRRSYRSEIPSYRERYEARGRPRSRTPPGRDYQYEDGSRSPRSRSRSPLAASRTSNWTVD